MYIPTNPQFDVKNSSTTAIISGKTRMANSSNINSNIISNSRMTGITKNHQNNHRQHHPQAHHHHHHWSDICTEFFRVMIAKKKPNSTVNNNNNNQHNQQNYNNINGNNNNNELCLEQLSDFQKNYVSFPDFDTYETNTSNVTSTILTTTDRTATKTNATGSAAVVLTSPSCGQNHSITIPGSNYWELTSHC